MTLPSLNIAPERILTMHKNILASLAVAEPARANEARVLETKEAVSMPVPEARAFTSAGTLPERIVIEKIGVSSPVVNPTTTDIGLLDAELKKGVVRYPGSGYLNEDKNIFLFAHSTGLSNVRNEAYQAFNGLGKLNIGDVIKVYAKNEMYEYSVVSVSLAKAGEALVDFKAGRAMLTLSTCDTFGKKEDRFVVTAELLKHTALSDSKNI